MKEEDYKFIIDEVCPQKKSRELVRCAIPILIRWAKQRQTDKTYSDLTRELGYKKAFSAIGRLLGYIDNVLKELGVKIQEDIPTLNALVKSKSTDLPSHGFSYVHSSYDHMSDNEKRIFIRGLNQMATDYESWDWILSLLGLTPSVIDTNDSEKSIRSGKNYGSGGEGENHKKLKEYIYNHPESLGLKKVKENMMEYILLSGDRLDVFIRLTNDTCVAVEVKSISSSDADIMRGLYQCVKYTSIMEAENKVHGIKTDCKSILVIEGSLSWENQLVRDTLGVTVVENFNYK